MSALRKISSLGRYGLNRPTMKRIDRRFSFKKIVLLQQMLGNKFVRYKSDSMNYGIIGIQINDNGYAFTNYVEIDDYYGKMEDVAKFKVNKVAYDEIRSPFQEPHMNEKLIDCLVKEVYVINEKQTLYINDKITYEVRLTRGVIFKFEEGYELSIEKNVWFSEVMSLEIGHNLINTFTPVEEFSDDWCEPCRGECIREIIKLS